MMKAYVLRCKRNQPVIEFEYGTRPDVESRYSTRAIAESDCRNFNSLDVHVGMHRCSFAVDDLPEGDFGIICICHPMAAPERVISWPHVVAS